MPLLSVHPERTIVQEDTRTSIFTVALFTTVRTRTQPQCSSVQLLSHVQLFATPWTAARQAALPNTNSRSLLKLMSIESVMPSDHLILCRPFPSHLQSCPVSKSFQMSQLFALCWPKYWSFSFYISPRCPSTNQWIKMIWYIFTMEYYPAIKWNEIGSFVGMWMDQESVIQNEVIQK